MKKVHQIIVDEAVPNEAATRFQSFLEKRGFKKLEMLFIKDKHPGMPDSQILHHLLNQQTILLTTDRPLHNKVLSLRLKSYYTDRNSFTGRKLKGIRIPKDFEVNKKNLELKESYHLPETAIRPLLLPSSEKRLKNLRTKRRRIRNHFGGQDHLEQVAITVSWKSVKSSTLFGIKFKVSSNIGLKALDASESYIRETVPPENRNIVALNFALILAIQLMLHFVKIQVYYDSPKIDDPANYLKNSPPIPQGELFCELAKNFPELEFIPSTKGPFIERLRTKLNNLAASNSNEIVAGNIAEIVKKVQDYRLEN